MGQAGLLFDRARRPVARSLQEQFAESQDAIAKGQEVVVICTSQREGSVSSSKVWALTTRRELVGGVLAAVIGVELNPLAQVHMPPSRSDGEAVDSFGLDRVLLCPSTDFVNTLWRAADQARSPGIWLWLPASEGAIGEGAQSTFDASPLNPYLNPTTCRIEPHGADALRESAE